MTNHKIHIHFATHLSARQPAESKMNAAGTVYLNVPGLLSELEKRLGLGGDFPTHRDRLSRFQQALEQLFLQLPTAFYAESMKKDPVAVAEQLLGWRDELISMGWNATDNFNASRLQQLAEAEKLFFSDNMEHYGVADRWKDVNEKLAYTDIETLGIAGIVSYDNLSLLHPQIQGVLEKLKDIVTETKISAHAEIKPESNLYKIQQGLETGAFQGELNENDNSLHFIRFTDNLLAAEFMAAQIEKGWNPILIGSDRSVLDDCLSARSCPATGSTLESANTSIIQLFKLLPVAHIAPLNIHNLMALLQSPFAPFNGSLRFMLSKVLSEKPGVKNKDWDKAISDFKEREQSKLTSDMQAKGETEQAIKSAVNALTASHDSKIRHYLNFKNQHSTTVDLKNISEMLTDARKWVIAKLNTGDTEEVKRQFKRLGEMCAALALRIQLKMDEGQTELRNEEFLKLLHAVYEPADFINFPRQIHSAHALNHAGGAVAPADVFVWTDFYNGIGNGGQRFLTDAEEQEISAKGARIYPVRNRMQLAFEACKRSVLLSKKQCILIVCETHNGEPATEHPLHTLINSAYRDADKLITDYSPGMDLSPMLNIQCHYDNVEAVDLPLPAGEFLRINPNLVNPRNTESASSLEKLIEYPFEWTVQYAAQFKAGSAFAIPDMLLLKGNISHAAMEEMLTPFEAGQQISQEQIEEILNQKILEGGANLLLPENRFELEAFRRDFIKSALSLVEIINLNNLKVIGCEKPLREETDPPFEIEHIGEVKGFMDLLLQKENGTFVVLDLKWAFNVAKYEKKIAEGSSIQLALYARAKGMHTETAYFILSSNTLISRHNFQCGNANFIRTGLENDFSEESTMRRSVASYQYRMDELQRGEIEMAEGMKLEDMEYGKMQDEFNLISIADKKGEKKKNFYSGLDLFKGGIV